MDLLGIQKALRSLAIDGWLFFDHHHRDPLSYRILGLPASAHVTRRWYYLIPAEGEPEGLVHRIEAGILSSLPGRNRLYSSWPEQASQLGSMLAACRTVAMQYSPQCAIPYVSMVDAGTVELVRGLGKQVVSSAELVQLFEARWSSAALESHLEAGRRVDKIRNQAFDMIGERIRGNGRTDEFAVKQFVLDSFRKAGLVTESGPIVAANANSANPHYSPTPESSQKIRPGDFVLLDMWAKLDQPGSVYYDITWTGFCGSDPPEQVRNLFALVRDARDAAINLVQNAVVTHQELRGFQVDDAARSYIRDRGFGTHFVHRTGHSIGCDIHGNGANMDNLETHDERRIIPWTGFSIEPGVYLRDFGVRSEVNVFVGEREAMVTGQIQRELVDI